MKEFEIREGRRYVTLLYYERDYLESWEDVKQGFVALFPFESQDCLRRKVRGNFFVEEMQLVEFFHNERIQYLLEKQRFKDHLKEEEEAWRVGYEKPAVYSKRWMKDNFWGSSDLQRACDERDELTNNQVRGFL